MSALVRTVRIILVLVTFPLVPALAQNVTLGVKLGPNGGDIAFEPAEDTRLRVGFMGGAALAFGVHPAFGVQLEVLFSQKGAKVDDPSSGTSATFGVNYLEVPLLARVSVPTGTVRPVFFLGPAVAFETSCSVSGEMDGVQVDVDCDAPLLDGGLQRKKTDVGVVAGAGFDVDVGPAIVQFEGRYNLGLTNLDDSGDPGASAKTRRFRC